MKKRDYVKRQRKGDDKKWKIKLPLNQLRRRGKLCERNLSGRQKLMPTSRSKKRRNLVTPLKT